MAISASQLYLITSCEEPKEAWDALKKHFERNTGKQALPEEEIFSKGNE